MVVNGGKWGIQMFMGEFHHNIDEKKRIIVPSKFRYELGESFIITRGIDSCLFVYPKTEWIKIVSKLNELSFTKKDVRSFQRFFLSGATECGFDKQGRINITSPLAEYADLTKECVIIGVNDRLEIWSKNNFNNFIKENVENVSSIAENLFESNVNA